MNIFKQVTEVTDISKQILLENKILINLILYILSVYIYFVEKKGLLTLHRLLSLYNHIFIIIISVTLRLPKGNQELITISIL
jgi:hypothetical protein